MILTIKNLYILDRTELADIHRLAKPPVANDVIIYFRAAQDPRKVGAKRMQENGIEVLQATDLLDIDSVEEIDAIGARFMRTWFFHNDVDISLLESLSLGKSYALEIARQSNPRLQIWYGEIVRRALMTYPTAEAVFSDIEDGGGVFDHSPANMPFRRVICLVAQTLGRTIEPLSSPQLIPPSFTRTRKSSWRTIFRGWASGLRPGHFFSRMKSLREVSYQKKTKPVLYNFMGRGHNLLRARIAVKGRFYIIGSLFDIEGAGYVRHDHLFALPAIADLKIARQLLLHLRSLIDGHALNVAGAELNGINYFPLLATSVLAVIRTQIWPFLFVIAQSRKLQRVCNFDALLLNAAGNEAMGTLTMLNQQSDCKIYLSPHGMCMNRAAVFGPVFNNSHVKYITEGTSHHGPLRAHDTQGPAPVEYPLGNSLTVMMNDICGKRTVGSKKRLLVLGFGHIDYWRADRIYVCDQYYIELFKIFRDLINEGWSISLRLHPGLSQALERKLAREFSIEGDICWDDHSSLNESLLAHDCVVSNLTSAYYQALYAGWPTIFYEPSPLGGLGPKDISESVVLTGLPIASDLERPVTNIPSELLDMIRSTLDPKSMVSTFPDRFVSELAPRFIGPEPEHADEIIANFIEEDFFDDLPIK